MGLIRFILAISVIIVHSSPIIGMRLVGGQIAVQSFYIISGFYMTLILKEKYIGTNNSYKLYITNRLLKLYPIYWTVLLLTIIYCIIMGLISNGDDFIFFQRYLDYASKMNFSSLFFLLFSNIFLLFQDLIMFLGLNSTTGELFFTPNFRETNPKLYSFLFVPQAWTIGIEIAFYLIAPFIVRKKIRWIILTIVLSFLLRFILMDHGFKGDPWTYRFLPTELAYFLLGSLSYHIYKISRTLNLKRKYLIVIFGIVLMVIFLYNFIPVPGKSYIFLFCFALAVPFIFELSKNWKRDRYIGELSYPMYISHILLLLFIKALNFQFSYLNGLVLTSLSVVLSIGLYELVAKKVDRIRQKRLTPIIKMNN